MVKLNGVKVRCSSTKECLEVLDILFMNGHAWRGGSTVNTLAQYEIDNLYGLYIKDTDKSDYYQQNGAITFETYKESFWSDALHIPMSIQQVKDYYGGVE